MHLFRHPAAPFCLALALAALALATAPAALASETPAARASTALPGVSLPPGYATSTRRHPVL